jgi:uncharacterized protein (DUF305 family)
MHSHYKKLGLMLLLNTVIMFFLNYSMVESIDHFYFNINAIYMTLMMAASMAILMLFLMRSMYQNKMLNCILYTSFAVLFVGSLLLTRNQTLVGNQQFLRSMIPHHSSAILMCQESSIEDPQISKLCSQIIKSQTEEIA